MCKAGGDRIVCSRCDIFKRDDRLAFNIFHSKYTLLCIITHRIKRIYSYTHRRKDSLRTSLNEILCVYPGMFAINFQSRFDLFRYKKKGLYVYTCFT